MTSIKNRRDELLTGVMLGDGCLYLHKDCITPILSYTAKHKEHINYIENLFDFVNFRKYKHTVYDKRTRKHYSRFTIRSRVLSYLVPHYNAWYVDHKKIKIPRNVKLTPTACLLWYIGDGYLDKDSGYIKLSTDCFEKSAIKTLVGKLKKFKAWALTNVGEQQRIYISKKYVKAFLDYIGPCPVKCYAYKWNTKPYKYKVYEEGVTALSSKRIEKFIELYCSGASYYAIGKLYGVHPTRVKHYLKQFGVYKIGRDVLKRKLNKKQLSLNKVLYD